MLTLMLVGLIVLPLVALPLLAVGESTRNHDGDIDA